MKIIKITGEKPLSYRDGKVSVCLPHANADLRETKKAEEVGLPTSVSETPIFICYAFDQLALFTNSNTIGAASMTEYGGWGVRPYVDGAASSSYFYTPKEAEKMIFLERLLESSESLWHKDWPQQVELVDYIDYPVAEFGEKIFEGRELVGYGAGVIDTGLYGFPGSKNGELSQTEQNSTESRPYIKEIKKEDLVRISRPGIGCYITLSKTPFGGSCKILKTVNQNPQDEDYFTEHYYHRQKGFEAGLPNLAFIPSHINGIPSVRRTSLGHWEMKGVNLPIANTKKSNTINPPHQIRYASTGTVTENVWWYDGDCINYLLKGDEIEYGVN
jgi:hypothetical protein